MLKHIQAVIRRTIYTLIMSVFTISALIALESGGVGGSPAYAQNNFNAPVQGTYSSNEMLRAGHNFFGGVSSGLAGIMERAFQSYGLPNAYILGEEASGAFIAGLRYGEGTLYTKGAGNHKIFFQGPSIGWDFGGNGSRVMMLVYNLPTVDHAYQRFAGVNGSAYVIGGIGMTVLANRNIVIVPVRSGIGVRLGVNVGYMKFTPKSTWNPF